MGIRGPVPKRRSLRRRRNTDVSGPTTGHVVRVCNRAGCEAIAGHARYDPARLWCLRGHAQGDDVADGRQWWHPPPGP